MEIFGRRRRNGTRFYDIRFEIDDISKRKIIITTIIIKKNNPCDPIEDRTKFF